MSLAADRQGFSLSGSRTSQSGISLIDAGHKLELQQSCGAGLIGYTDQSVRHTGAHG